MNELEKYKSILQRQQRQAQINMENMVTVKKTYEASLQKYIVEVDRLNGIMLKMQAENEDLKHRNAEYERQVGILEANER